MSSSLSVVIVQITCSGFTISIPTSGIISAAVTVLGPLTERVIFLSPVVSALTTISFMFRIISVTASLTPSITENSLNTPLILTPLIAAPGIDESKTLLKALPTVCP